MVCPFIINIVIAPLIYNPLAETNKDVFLPFGDQATNIKHFRSSAFGASWYFIAYIFVIFGYWFHYVSSECISWHLELERIGGLIDVE